MDFDELLPQQRMQVHPICQIAAESCVPPGGVDAMYHYEYDDMHADYAASAAAPAAADLQPKQQLRRELRPDLQYYIDRADPKRGRSDFLPMVLRLQTWAKVRTAS